MLSMFSKVLRHTEVLGALSAKKVKKGAAD